jgi:hypothetical protein
MFFRFLTAIVDDDETVAKFGQNQPQMCATFVHKSDSCVLACCVCRSAEQSLTNLLVTKSPNRFQQHFVETVFYLNGNRAD